MSNNSETGLLVFLIFMACALGLIWGSILGSSGPRVLNPEEVKTNPTECRLDRYNNAQKYIESCAPAFKQAVETVK